jgi:hypothetical protein
MPESVAGLHAFSTTDNPRIALSSTDFQKPVLCRRSEKARLFGRMKRKARDFAPRTARIRLIR